MEGQTRRDVLKAARVAGAAALLARDGEAAGGEPAAIVSHRSTSGVIVPPRGASFMQWSLDSPAAHRSEMAAVIREARRRAGPG